MVCSGKGGTGKSTVSVLLGACWRGWGGRFCSLSWIRVCVVWTLLRASTAAPSMTLRMSSAADARGQGRCAQPALPRAVGHQRPYEGGAVDAAPLGRLLVAMRPYFDFVILDTAAGMGAPFTAAAAVADKALLVLTPTRSPCATAKLWRTGCWPGHAPKRRAVGDEPRQARALAKRRCG